MPSRTPGDQPDPAAELLGRWQAHHAGSPESSADGQTPEEPPADAGDPSDDPAGDPAGPARPRHAATRPDQPRPTSTRGADQIEAGREVVEALGLAGPSESTRAPEPVELPASPEPAEAPPTRRTTGTPSTSRSTDVDFPPRLLVRRILGLVLLVVVVAAGGAAYVAYEDPTTLSLGVAGTLVVLALALYGVRAGSTPARLAIRSGQLEVVRGNQREVFDLTSRFTRMEVVGKPGRPGWKVLMARFGRDPLVIDSSMVDPSSFTAALERHRPTR